MVMDNFIYPAVGWKESIGHRPQQRGTTRECSQNKHYFQCSSLWGVDKEGGQWSKMVMSVDGEDAPTGRGMVGWKLLAGT